MVSRNREDLFSLQNVYKEHRIVYKDQKKDEETFEKTNKTNGWSIEFSIQRYSSVQMIQVLTCIRGSLVGRFEKSLFVW